MFQKQGDDSAVREVDATESRFVLVDGRLIHRPMSGLERYIRNLALGIGQSGTQLRLGVSVEWPSRADAELSALCQIIPVRGTRDLAQRVTEHAPEIYHLTWLGYDPEHYLPLAVARAGVLTIPDFILWDHPEYSSSVLHHQYRTALNASLAWADRVVVYSNFTKEQVVEKLRVPASRIGVVPLAPESRFWDPMPKVSAAAVPGLAGRPFVLALGKDYPHKNLGRLVEAFAIANLREHVLVVAGEPVWPGARLELARLARDRGIQERVIFVDHVSDDRLPSLFRASDAFVFASLEEGFGLPPLEAMAAGVPVVCSDAGPLPEVVGDAAYLVDARDSEAIASGLRRVLGEQQLRAELIKRGENRARQFSWQKTAEKTIENYVSVVSDAKRGRARPKPGVFVREFPSSLPFISHALAENETHPGASTLIWIESQVYDGQRASPLSRLRFASLVEWLSGLFSLTPAVDVLSRQDLPLGLTVAEAVAFSRSRQVIVISTHHADAETEALRGLDAEELAPTQIPSRIKELLTALGDPTIPDDSLTLVSARAPDWFVTQFNPATAVRFVFPINHRASLEDPQLWFRALCGPDDRIRSFTPSMVLVGDERASADWLWVKQFRSLVQGQGCPGSIGWLADGANLARVVSVLGQPALDEWVFATVSGLTAEQATSLASRLPEIKVALVLADGEAIDQLSAASILELAWYLKPDAIITRGVDEMAGSRFEEALADEVRAITTLGRLRDQSVYSRLLERRLELSEARRREREMVETALQSHLAGVRSYQEQLERYDRDYHTLANVVARMNLRLNQNG